MHDIGAPENTPTTDKAEGDAQTPKPTPPEPAPEQDGGDSTDWKSEAKKWEARAKANKNAARKLAELEEAAKSEEQKRFEKTEQLEKELAAYKQRDQVKAWAEEIVKDSGIPASVLRGSTQEELLAHFEQLKPLLEAKPASKPGVFPGFDKQPDNGGADSAWLGRLFGKQ